MSKSDIDYFKEEISRLPTGNISYKTINGKSYPYLQWQENGKQRSRLVKQNELTELSEKIERRKELEKRVEYTSGKESAFTNDSQFFSSVLRGKDLAEFAAPTAQWKRRECFSTLSNFVYGSSTDRVFILYGLRRTGKTTMIRQLIAEMPKEIFSKTAYLQLNTSITLEKIDADMRLLAQQGYRYLFIDEVTLMDDFIEDAALFSDVYATRGIKIVLSGTDSLGFIFSEDRELYDRCYMLHTTFVPYKEFEEVLGQKGIDKYIMYGGTMSLGGVNYNSPQATFATKESTDEYVDIAIAHNIQHSLKNYRYGRHFHHLLELYEADELTSAINRIVEDINHRFTIDVLTRDFQSSDLSLSNRNLLKDREDPITLLSRVDREHITEQFRGLLDIKNKKERSIAITDGHRLEIKQYLDLLDITVDLDVVYLPDFTKNTKHTVVTQPGLRYAQADALIRTLMKDNVFRSVSLKEKNAVTQRILNDIRGRMMEDIVLLETKLARSDCEVFKLMFTTGEFDMVVFNPSTESCEIFEIKHSTEIAPQQTQHLRNVDKCADTEFHYGTITGKYVLYRGEPSTVDDIQYLNVEEYLKNL